MASDKFTSVLLDPEQTGFNPMLGTLKDGVVSEVLLSDPERASFDRFLGISGAASDDFLPESRVLRVLNENNNITG